MQAKLIFKKARVLCFMFLLLGGIAASAQTQKTIKGMVVSTEDNSPLPGATVLEKGTTNGTSTDFDGVFSLSVGENATTLVVSFIGFKTQEVEISDEAMTIILQQDNILDEVVVVGYGTIRKSDIISSVATVDVEEATIIPTSNINEMLRGRASGVQVTVGTLRPGGTSDVVIRGRNSLAGNNNPIYIVDGVAKDDINDISPEDITSIEILKDASAQAIYGSRASNGVILVTTKRGVVGKVKVDYHGYFTTQSISKNFDLYDGNEYAQLRREAFRTDNPDDAYEPDDFVFTEEELAALNSQQFSNWEDLVFTDANISSNTFSLSGGSENTKVYASVNYFKQFGIIPSSSFSRGTFRLNLDQKINDKLSFAINVALTSSEQDKESASLNLITLSPLGQAYDDDGNLVRYPVGSASYTNPLWNINESTNDIKSNSYDAYFVLKYDFHRNWTYTLNTSLGRKGIDEGLFYGLTHSTGKNTNGLARISNSLRENFLIENIVRYENQFNENNKLDVTLMQSIDERKFSSTTSTGTDFSNESLGYNGISSALNVLPVGRYAEERKLVSFMARARYGFKDKYLFTATARADGSSVFAEGNKWGFFPSMAFAWKLHNEDFLKDSNVVDQLKFRLSYGAIGNEAIRPYQTLGTASEFLYVFNGVSQSGYLPSTVLPNPDLRWETTTSFNIGLDYMFLDNILSGTFEFYSTSTKDLLVQRSVSGITGYTSTFDNAGEVKNSGFELNLTGNIIRKEDLRWSITAMYSNNNNNIEDLYGLDENGEPINDEGRGYFVGQPTSVIYQYAFDGIWQEGEDYANSPQANPESSNTQTDLAPGNIRIKDLQGRDDDGNLTGLPDGKITADDRVFTNPNPDWFASLSTTLFFKGFDLFADFYFVQGAMKVNPYLADFNAGGTLQGVLNGIKVPYYTPENPSSSYPRPRSSQSDSYLWSLAVQDASYVRLRTLSLAYNFTYSLMSTTKVDGIQLYVTANNLFTITDYKSYSPEINNDGYPDAKAFTIGLRVNF